MRPCQARTAFLLFLMVALTARDGIAQGMPTSAQRDAACEELSELTGIPDSLRHDGKCGFRWMAAVTRQMELTPSLRAAELAAMLAPATAAVETVIGQFRFVFDTSGSGAPALLDSLNNRIPGTARAYVDSVGKVFQEVWERQISHLEYASPPMTNGTYQVVILELGGSYYGQTLFESTPFKVEGGASYYRSSIEIDNDFREFKTKGMNGLKVTAAHEFHHAIQIGSYGVKWNGSEFLDQYAYEITSTWMEDVVYPEINDYLQYLPDFFGSTILQGFSAGRSFVNDIFPGYERCVWGHFLGERYGSRTMTDVWESMKTKRFLPATAEALRGRNVSMETAFANFSYWNYFTADHGDPTRSYADGSLFPRYRRFRTLPLSGAVAESDASMERLAATMTDVVIDSDTLTAIIVNVNVAGAIEDYNAQEPAAFMVSRSPLTMPYQTLQGGINVGVSVPVPSEWRTFYLGSGRDVPREQRFPYPNPMRLRLDDGLLLPVSASVGEKGDVMVMSFSADRVLYGTYSVITVQGANALFIPSSELRARAGSGTYTVAATVGGKDYLWNVVLIQ